jgi:tetratricopeptide (TPR) repeat protein
VSPGDGDAPGATTPGAAAGRGTVAGPGPLDLDEGSVEFLERSLADLDAELAAGDLSAADHARLRDGYTARLARALRGEDPDPPPPPVGPARSPWPRRLLGGGLVVVFALVAGFGVAAMSGTRTSQDGLTGDIRTTQRNELARCLELATGTDVLEAVKCYDGVLQDDPASVEALTYRGWILVRTNDARLLPVAAQSLDQAVALDPTYPDARAFRAVVLLQLGRAAEAGAELDAFDALDPPQLMKDLVAQFGLREQIQSQLGG